MKHLLQLLTLCLLAASLAGCARPDFNAAVDAEAIVQAMQSSGLQICAQDDLTWEVTPGFAEGKYFDLDANCAAYDPNKPGVRVYIARFDSADARDAALRNFDTTYRRHIGPSISRAIGPWIIVVDGNQSSAAADLLRAALSKLGAQ